MKTSEAFAWMRRLLSGASLSALSSAASQAGTFAVGVLVARVAGRPTFGDWTLLYGTILAAISLSSMGVGFTTLRFAAEYRWKGAQALVNILAPIRTLNTWMAAIAVILVVAGAGPICEFILHRPDLIWFFRASAGFVLFAVMGSFWSGILTGFEKYSRQFVHNIIATLISLSCAFIFIRTGLTAAVLALTAGAATTFFANRWAVVHGPLPSMVRASPANQEIWNSILGVLVPTSISGLASAAAIWGIQIVLSRHDIRGYTLADFGAALGLRNIAFFGLQFMNSAGAVLMSASLGSETKRGQFKLQLMAHSTVTLSAMAIAATLLLFPSQLLLIFGREFAQAVPVLQILAISIIFDALGGSLYNVILTRRQLVVNLWLALLPREFARLVVSMMLIPCLGAAGAGYGFLVSSIFFACATGLQAAFPFIRSRLGIADIR